jgi:phosphoribosylglycinamide formyltransferase 1
MAKKIMIVTSGSGSLIDICLGFNFFKDQINLIVCDRDCGAIKIADKYNIKNNLIVNEDSNDWNNELLKIAMTWKIDYILSYSNLKIFKGEILNIYENKIFNSHYSILPSFKGFYSSKEIKTKFQAREVFERTIDFGSRITGNTIHVVNKKIDNGCPVLVSVLNIPYYQDIKVTRHRLFMHECQSILQLIDWLSKDQVCVNKNGKIEIHGASFESLGFSPNLQREEIINFKL